MKNFLRTFLILLILCSSSLQTFADGDKPAERYTLSGYIKDTENGEVLIGATVYITNLKIGAVTNLYGFYSITLTPGDYKIVYTYLGYKSIEKEISLKSNMVMNIDLSVDRKDIEEVTITTDRPEMNVQKAEMSVSKLDMKTIRQIPALMGEVDLIKAIQLLPGVQSAAEGTSAFNVRGGSADQNLILLDEATVYNASHLMGFFSVFNNDAIRDVKLYKGDIPASNGGRLSSFLDVRMKDGNNKKFHGTGGIGSISSRLTLEGPIWKDRTSFIASGRRTYMDIFTPLATDEGLKDSKLYFYDLNLKLNHKFSDNDRIFLSGYMGRDVFKNSFAGMAFGNRTLTARWNHLFSQKLFSNISLIYSYYNYDLSFEQTESENFRWMYDMVDLGAKGDFTYYLRPNYTIKFGFQNVYHTLNPGTVDMGDTYPRYILPSNYSLEHAAYIAMEHDITPKLALKYGIRYSLFQNMGKGTVYNINEAYEATDSTVYSSGKIFNNYQGLEPRLGIKYEINDMTSVKASYSRTRQYMQMATNATAGTPLDLWFTASPNVKPQISDQYAVGVFRNLFNNKLQTSVEVYYKTMNNVIDFKDHAQLLLNRKIEAELRFGKGKAYGAEFMIEFPETRLNGWVSYTYSHTERTIPEINKGKTFIAPYDKPHNVNIVLNFNLSKRASLGGTWVYATGAPATFPTGRAVYGNKILPIYTDRNTYRLPDYHRLDVAFTLRSKEKPGRWWHGEWNFSVYNLYGRKNAWVIKFIEDKEIENTTHAEKLYLFYIVPSITYNFKF